MTMPDGYKTVLPEIWPVGADEDGGLWLLSANDAWRPTLPTRADMTIHGEVEYQLASRDVTPVRVVGQASRDVVVPPELWRAAAVNPPPYRPPAPRVPPEDAVPPGAVVMLHSTSWRDDGPSVVLTFVAVLATAGPVRERWPQALPIGADLARHVGRPTPHGPTEAPAPRYVDVLLHALRHLAYLRVTDTAVAAALDSYWHTHLAELTPLLAGMYLHDEAA